MNVRGILLLLVVVRCNSWLEDKVVALESEVKKNEAHINYLKGFIKGKGDV